MANQTIYPYGTNGELPSNIGIINDLTTGGSDKALSAEMGKQLNSVVVQKQDKIIEHNVLSPISWVKRVASGSDNTLSVIDYNSYSCSLYVNNTSTGSRFAMKVDGLTIGTTYNYEFYLYKLVDGEEIPVSTLTGGGSYDKITDDGNNQSITLTRSYGSENQGRYYGTIKRTSSYGNYWSFALASQTSWLSVGDTLVVRMSRLYSDDAYAFGFDDEPIQDSVNLVKSGGIYGFVKKQGVQYEINPSDIYGFINGVYIDGSAKWKTSSTTSIAFIKLLPSHRYRLVLPVGVSTVYSLLNEVPSSTPSNNTSVTQWASGESGRHEVYAEDTYIDTPNDDSIYYCYHVASTDRRVNWKLYDAETDVFGEELERRESRRYAYDGEDIDLSDKPRKCNVIYNTAFKTTTHQSSSLFGYHLFVVMNGDSVMTIHDYYIGGGYNPKGWSVHAPIYGSYTTVPNIGNATRSHCNSCAFSNNYYDASDDFPIFYITVNDEVGGRVQWAGYRVVNPVYKEDGSISSFSLENVHNIFLPVETEDNGLGNTNVVFDRARNEFWGYGRYNGTGSEWSLKMTYTRFGNIPYNGTTDVYLTDDDIKEQFRYKDISMAYAQGGCIKNDWLIFGQGYNSVNLIYCNIVNLRTHELTRLDLKALGFTYEPEGAFVMNNAICLTTAQGYEYIITL